MPEAGFTISIYSLLCYFLLYAFLGWCLEVVFCSINTGKFVNRGFLNGALCPIYGFGGCILVVALSPITHSIPLLFVASVVLASLLELVTGWLLKKIFHTSWWDYSDQPFNIGGYICLKFSLVWGLAGVFLMRVLHPVIAGFVALIPHTLGVVLLVVLYALLLCDVAVTVAAVRKMNRDLGEITKLAQSLHKGSEAVAEGLGNTAIGVAKRVEELHLDEKKQQIVEKWEDERAKADASLQQAKAKLTASVEATALGARLEELFSRQRSPVRARLLKAFPDMKSSRYAEALDALKQRLGGKSPDKNSAPPAPADAADTHPDPQPPTEDTP